MDARVVIWFLYKKRLLQSIEDLPICRLLSPNLSESRNFYPFWSTLSYQALLCQLSLNTKFPLLMISFYKTHIWAYRCHMLHSHSDFWQLSMRSLICLQTKYRQYCNRTYSCQKHIHSKKRKERRLIRSTQGLNVQFPERLSFLKSVNKTAKGKVSQTIP